MDILFMTSPPLFPLTKVKDDCLIMQAIENYLPAKTMLRGGNRKLLGTVGNYRNEKRKEKRKNKKRGEKL